MLNFKFYLVALDGAPVLDKKTGKIVFGELGSSSRLLKASDEEGDYLKRLLPLYSRGGQLLFLDTNFACPIRILESVENDITRIRGYDIQDRVINDMLRVGYGQTKALKELTIQGKVITHPSVFKELEQKRRKLGRKTQSLVPGLYNTFGIDDTLSRENIGLVQEIDDNYGAVVSIIRNQLPNFQDFAIKASNLAEKIAEATQGSLGYYTHRRTKRVSMADLELFLMAKDMGGVILSSDNDMHYLGVKFSKFFTSPLICGCVNMTHYAEIQDTFGRYRGRHF